MLVDDDDAVRATLASSLQDAGFAVASVESAERALGELRLGLEIDVLITDLSMPGMNGWDLVREFRSQRPQAPSVLLTGNLEDADAETQACVEDKRFLLLRKPIAPSLLARRVTALLGADAAAPGGGPDAGGVGRAPVA
jgi:CheY-like chemotaxis protein